MEPILLQLNRVLRPFLMRAIQEQRYAGQDVTSQYAAVTVNKKISPPVSPFEKDHVQFNNLGGASATGLLPKIGAI